MTMPKYLIDVNLPCYFGSWQKPDFLSQMEIDPKADDSKSWDYAQKHNLIIVTQDTDFYNRIILHAPPPKVIWFRTGNMRLQQFKAFVQANWSAIEKMSDTHKLVIVYLNRVEGTV